MEGSAEGIVRIYSFESEIREPFMGNAVPVRVLIFIHRNNIIRVEVENPEGMRRESKLVELSSMPWSNYRKLFHDETRWNDEG